MKKFLMFVAFTSLASLFVACGDDKKADTKPAESNKQEVVTEKRQVETNKPEIPADVQTPSAETMDSNNANTETKSNAMETKDNVEEKAATPKDAQPDTTTSTENK